MNITEIAQITGHDRKTVFKYPNEMNFLPKFPPPRRASKLDPPYKPGIDEFLKHDLQEFGERHNPIREIYEQVQKSGYTGGVSTVDNYVKAILPSIGKTGSSLLMVGSTPASP